jgi:tetratricopeptide (TPR) repeat protein/O-antigen ligase
MQEPSLARWLRWLVYASAAIPLIIFSQHLSPFHFGKVVVLRSLVEIMIPMYVLLIWQDRRYMPKSHPITWGLLAFTAAFTLTTITSVAPTQSFWGTLERMGGLWTFYHYIVFYLIAVSVMRARKDWQLLFDLMIAAGILSAIYGFLQRTNLSFIIGSGGRERIFGTIGNPALFAGYEIIIGYLALTLAFLSSTVGLRRRLYMTAGVIMLIAAAMPAVRGSLLAMVIATVLAALLYTSYYRSRKARFALLGMIGAVLVFFALALSLRGTPWGTSFIQHSSYLNRVTDFSPQTTTVQTRFWAWSAGFKGWSETPRTVLVGWGPENFNVPFSKYFNPKFFTGPGAETFFDRAHNMFVEVLTTMGLVGEVAYLSIFVALAMTLIRLIKKEGDTRLFAIGMSALAVAYVIHNTFIFDTSANFLAFFTVLAFVTHVSWRGIDAVPERSTAKASSIVPSALQMSTVGVIAVVMLVVIYATNIESSRANYALTRGIVAGWSGDFYSAVAKYREAIDADTFGRYEFRHRYVQYLLEVSGSNDIKKVPEFDQLVRSAIDDLKHNIDENPQDYLPYLYASRLYLTLGRDDSKSPDNQTALEYSRKALEISPTFVRTWYEVAQAYMNMKQYDQAFSAFEMAAELNPNVGLSYWYMAAVKYQQKQNKEALHYIDLAFQHDYTPTEADSLKLVNLYVEAGDLKNVVKVYETLTKNYPTKAQYWASLAVAYAQSNRIQDAIDAVRTAISLNPNDAEFVAQANAFLHQLGAQ